MSRQFSFGFCLSFDGGECDFNFRNGNALFFLENLFITIYMVLTMVL